MEKRQKKPTNMLKINKKKEMLHNAIKLDIDF